MKIFAIIAVAASVVYAQCSGQKVSACATYKTGPCNQVWASYRNMSYPGNAQCTGNQGSCYPGSPCGNIGF